MITAEPQGFATFSSAEPDAMKLFLTCSYWLTDSRQPLHIANGSLLPPNGVMSWTGSLTQNFGLRDRFGQSVKEYQLLSSFLGSPHSSLFVGRFSSETILFERLMPGTFPMEIIALGSSKYFDRISNVPWIRAVHQRICPSKIGG